MERDLLDHTDVEMLRTHAFLGETVSAAWINQQPMVAVHNFVLPLKCFVTLWFWLMLDSRVYARHVENKYDLDLLKLNPGMSAGNLNKPVKSRVMEFVYSEVKYKFVPVKTANVNQKHQMLARVFEELGLDPTSALAVEEAASV